MWPSNFPFPTVGLFFFLFSLLGSLILQRFSGRGFIAYIVLVWAVITALFCPHDLRSWTNYPTEAIAGFALIAFGVGIPIWGASSCVYFLNQNGANPLLQGLGGCTVGLLLLPVSLAAILTIGI